MFEATTMRALDRASPAGLPDLFRLAQIGTVLAGHVPQQLAGKAPAAQMNELATLTGLGLPYYSRASAVLRATVRKVSGGAVLGELTPKLHDVTPSTGEVAVSPSGDVVFLAADLATVVDVVYAPIAGEVVELSLPAPAGIMTLPDEIVARQPLLLLEATATTATITGRKIVLAPAAAVVATTKAAIAIDRTKVYFNFATDVVTAATVKLLLAPRHGLADVLASVPTVVG